MRAARLAVLILLTVAMLPANAHCDGTSYFLPLGAEASQPRQIALNNRIDKLTAELQDARREMNAPHSGSATPDMEDRLRASKIVMYLEGIGSLYCEGSQYDRALPILTQSLALQDKFPRLAGYDSAETLDELAYASAKTNDPKTAEKDYRRALDLRESTLGRDNAAVAISLSRLGDFLQEQGRINEAEPLFQRALKIRQALFSHSGYDPDRNLIAKSLVDIGSVYRDQDRYKEAENSYREAMDIWDHAVVPSTSYLAPTLAALGEVLILEGRSGEAIPYLRRSLSLSRKHLNADDSFVKQVTALLHDAESNSAGKVER